MGRHGADHDSSQGEWDEEKMDKYAELIRGGEDMFQHHRLFAGACVVDDECPLELSIETFQDVRYENVTKHLWLSEDGEVWDDEYIAWLRGRDSRC